MFGKVRELTEKEIDEAILIGWLSKTECNILKELNEGRLLEGYQKRIKKLMKSLRKHRSV